MTQESEERHHCKRRLWWRDQS